MTVITKAGVMFTTIISVFPSREAASAAIQNLVSSNISDVQQATIITQTTTGLHVILSQYPLPKQGRRVGMRFGALLSAISMVQFGAFTLPILGSLAMLGLGALFGGVIGGLTGQYAAARLYFRRVKRMLSSFKASLSDNEHALVLRLYSTDNLPQLRAALQHHEGRLLEV